MLFLYLFWEDYNYIIKLVSVRGENIKLLYYLKIYYNVALFLQFLCIHVVISYLISVTKFGVINSLRIISMNTKFEMIEFLVNFYLVIKWKLWVSHYYLICLFYRSIKEKQNIYRCIYQTFLSFRLWRWHLLWH